LGLANNVVFPSGLNREDTQAAKDDIVSMLDSGLRGLRKAYRYAIQDPTLLALTEGNDNKPGKSTQATAYQQAQIANFQAALNRLSGGSSSSGLFI
jgi:hypothetical protein